MWIKYSQSNVCEEQSAGGETVWCTGPEIQQHGDKSVSSSAVYLSTQMESR